MFRTSGVLVKNQFLETFEAVAPRLSNTLETSGRPTTVLIRQATAFRPNARIRSRFSTRTNGSDVCRNHGFRLRVRSSGFGNRAAVFVAPALFDTPRRISGFPDCALGKQGRDFSADPHIVHRPEMV